MKFVKAFRGVPNLEIYPVDYEVGTECPPELEAAAKSVGAVSKRAPVPALVLPTSVASQSTQSTAPAPSAPASSTAVQTSVPGDTTQPPSATEGTGFADFAERDTGPTTSSAVLKD